MSTPFLNMVIWLSMFEPPNGQCFNSNTGLCMFINCTLSLLPKPIVKECYRQDSIW